MVCSGGFLEEVHKSKIQLELDVEILGKVIVGDAVPNAVVILQFKNQGRHPDASLLNACAFTLISHLNL